MKTESKYTVDTSADNSTEVTKVTQAELVASLLKNKGILAFLPDDKVADYIIATQKV